MENITKKETTNIYPVIPLRGKVAFPNTNLSFEVGRNMTLKAIEYASAASERTFFILTQKDTEKEDVTAEDLYSVGCVAKIKQIAQLTGGAVRVLCEVLYRAKARVLRFEEGYFSAVCDPIQTVHGDEVMEEAYFRTAKALVKDVASVDGKIAKDVLARLDRCQAAEEYVNVTMSAMRVRLEIKQSILEETKLIEQLKQFERCLNDELEISKIEKKIAQSVR